MEARPGDGPQSGTRPCPSLVSAVPVGKFVPALPRVGVVKAPHQSQPFHSPSLRQGLWSPWIEDSESDAEVPSSSALTVKEKRKCPSGITRGTEDLPPALTVHIYYRYSRSQGPCPKLTHCSKETPEFKLRLCGGHRGLLLSWLLWRQNHSPALEPSGPQPSWGTRGNPRQPASTCSLSSWVTCLVFSIEIISMSSSQERGKTKLKHQSHRNILRLISPDWPVAVVSH